MCACVRDVVGSPSAQPGQRERRGGAEEQRPGRRQDSPVTSGPAAPTVRCCGSPARSRNLGNSRARARCSSLPVPGSGSDVINAVRHVYIIMGGAWALGPAYIFNPAGTFVGLLLAWQHSFIGSVGSGQHKRLVSLDQATFEPSGSSRSSLDKQSSPASGCDLLTSDHTVPMATPWQHSAMATRSCSSF